MDTQQLQRILDRLVSPDPEQHRIGARAIAELAIRNNEEAIHWFRANLPGIQEKNPGYVGCLLDVLMVADSNLANQEAFERARVALRNPELKIALWAIKKDPESQDNARVLEAYKLVTRWPGSTERWSLTPLGETLVGKGIK